MTQPSLLTSFLTIAFATLASFTADTAQAQDDQATGLNILFITVDDMSADSIGAFGCKLPNTSPNVDQLAAQGLRFNHMHVVVGNCMPSRNVMWSGKYPHTTGVEGFYPIPEPDYPHLVDLMQDGGYFIGIRGKVSHSTPYHPYHWDAILDTDAQGNKHHMKDARSYYLSTRDGIAKAMKAGKPFCLIINISDPHKPFYSQSKRKGTFDDPHVPTRVFTADEVPVPNFLPDDLAIREEVALYYSSVRRADDCVGEILRALKKSGQEDHTVVMFLSDHGMPLPFAKTQLYHHSTHTPFIVKYPDVTNAGTVDNEHVLSAVDLTPTLLDIAGIEHPDTGFDGRSFAPTLSGKSQKGRHFAFKEYNENSAGTREPMRSVQGKRFGYIFNPWSNGERFMKTATQGTATYRKMKELAKTDEYVAGRVRLIDHRVPEEFYDYKTDPDGLHNLVDDPEYQDELKRHRQALKQHMTRTEDYALAAFEVRTDPEALEAFMSVQETQAADRKAAKRRHNNKKTNLFQLSPPKTFAPGEAVIVEIPHDLPQTLGPTKFHVTLKGGTQGKRLERKVLEVSGKGTLKVTFNVPKTIAGNQISFSAFAGEDFEHNLQHETSKPIPYEP
ncbi:MAG: sulfatase [Verrucomicrobiota bacterium]